MNSRSCDELKGDKDTASLWSSISATIDEETEASSAAQAMKARNDIYGRPLTYGAIAAALLVAVFVFNHVLHFNAPETPLIVTESINDLLTFRASGRSLDVHSAEPVALRNWFVKRLDFDVPLSAAMPAGFKLDGARLCSF